MTQNLTPCAFTTVMLLILEPTCFARGLVRKRSKW